MLKKICSFIIISSLIFVFSGCIFKNNKNQQELSVAVSATPHSFIVDYVKNELEKQNIILNVKIFTDYKTQNEALLNGEVDLNFFQTEDYLNVYNSEYKDKKYKDVDIVPLLKMHFEPIGIYSDKYRDISEVTDSATFAISDEKSNQSRSLFFLQSLGFIKLKENIEFASISDIVENNKKLQFVELSSESLAISLDKYDFCIINKNYAMVYKINDKNLLLEEVNQQNIDRYSNVVAGLKYNKDKKNEKQEIIDIFLDFMKSESVQNYIREKFDGEIFI